MSRNVYDEYPLLHHYTSFEKLENILHSQQLWASRHDCLNDHKEFVFAQEFVPKIIEPCIQNVLNDYSSKYVFPEGIANLEAENLYRILYETLEKLTDGFYVFCFSHFDEFSKNNGTLTMWRSYSDNGQGYALEFSTIDIIKLLKKQNESYRLDTWAFGDVFYSDHIDRLIEDNPDYYEDFKEYIQHIIISALSSDDYNESSSARGALSFLMSAISQSKHQAFVDEREVRLAIMPFSVGYKKSDKRLFIEKTSDKKQLKLFGCKELGQNLPITKILIGPGSGQDAREKKCKALLDDLKLDIPLVKSTIPFKNN